MPFVCGLKGQEGCKLAANIIYGFDCNTLLKRSYTLIGLPQPLHPIPLESHPRQLDKRLGNVKVDERRDFDEPHRVLLCIFFRFFLMDLPLKCQMKSIANQDFRDSRRVLQFQVKYIEFIVVLWFFREIAINLYKVSVFEVKVKYIELII